MREGADVERFSSKKSSDEGKVTKCSPNLCPIDDVFSFVPFKAGGSMNQEIEIKHLETSDLPKLDLHLWS